MTRNMRVGARAMLTSSFLFIAGCESQDAPRASAKDWPTAFATLVQTRLSSPPQDAATAIENCIVESIETRVYPGVPDSWMEAIYEATDRRLVTLLDAFPDTQRKLDVELAWLRYALTYLLTANPPSDKDAASLLKQIDEVVVAGSAWTATQSLATAPGILDEVKRTFRDRLETWYLYELGPWMGRPLPGSEHERLLAKWRETLHSVGPKLDSTASDYALKPEAAPGWELDQARQEKVERLVSFLMRSYADSRLEYVNPTGESAELYDAFKTAFQNLSADATRERQWRRAREREIQDWAEDVQEYEVLCAIYDSLMPANWFQVALSGDQPTFGASFPSGGRPFSIVYSVRYPTYDPLGYPDGSEFTVTGHVVVPSRAAVRTEVTSRKPLWRARGAFYEPIGLTVEQKNDALHVYFPGIWKFDVLSVSGKFFSPDEFRPALMAPRGPRVKMEAFNRVAMFSGQIERMEETEAPDGANVWIVWPERMPGLYSAAIARAQYRFVGKGDQRVLESARLFAAGEDGVAAEIQWRDPVTLPPGNLGYRRVRIEIHEPALINRRSGSETRLPVAEPRTIEWTYRITGDNPTSSMAPESMTIRTETGKTALEVTFDEPEFDSPAGAPETLEEPLRFGASRTDDRLAYYVLRKDYYRERKRCMPTGEEPSLDSLIARGRKLKHSAEANGETDVLLATQHILFDWFNLEKDYSAYHETAMEHLALVSQVGDERQVSIEAAWLISQHRRAGLKIEALDLIAVLAEQFKERLTAPQCVEKGEGLLFGGGTPQATACFLAAALKLKEGSPLWITAQFQLIQSYRKLHDEFSGAGESSDACTEIASRLNAAIDQFERYAPEKDRQANAEYLGRILPE